MTDERFLIMKDKIIKDIKEKILKISYEKILLNLGGNYIKLFDNIKDDRLIFLPFLRQKKIIKNFMIEYNKEQRKIFEYE